MKILVVHQYFLMPGMPGASRFNQLTRMWAQAGHDVTVIAGNLDYQSGETPERYRGRWIVREREGSVRVYRCHVPPSYKRSYRGRMWAFLGFTVFASLVALFVPRPDVVIATSPPLLTPIPAWIAARLRRRPAPWIFEIRDLWPESAVTTGVVREGSVLARALYALERWACRRAGRVNVLTPAFREDLLERQLVSPDKVCFIPNGADLDLFQPGPRDNAFRRKMGWGDRFVVLYAGAHGRANALMQLVEAAEHLRHHRGIRIACVGAGPERQALERAVCQRGLDNIAFLGPWPKQQMPEIVNASDVGVAVLQSNPTFRTVYPNKVFDYMACERPVLLAIDGVARTLVCDEAQAGVFVPPENAEAIASAIQKLAEDPSECEALGRKGRRWVLENADRERLAERYLELMQEVSRESERSSRPYDPLKRGIDVVVALLGLVLLAPVLGALALAIRIGMGSPVLFRQPRPGWRGEIFELVKFRTMRERRPGEDGGTADAARLTRLGRLLRAASLDELPTLWHVLRGEMSLVGPRPLLVEYLERYSPEQARRHDVKPGITGWAQVHGRNALDWQQRFELDVWYVDHRSLWLDLKILALTAFTVITREGISKPGHATVDYFDGNSSD